MKSTHQSAIPKPRLKRCRIKPVCAVLVFLCASSVYGADRVALREQVTEAEIAFAKTMADRDFDAFKTFLSEEAVFVSGNIIARGRAQIAEQWSAFYVGDEAPFSWHPELVVVLESGTLALSTGPVFDASGQLVSYYNSTWRREDSGTWRVVFDKGSKACGD